MSTNLDKINLMKKRLEVRTKGNENVKDTGLEGVPLDELKRRYNDPNTSNQEKKRIERHLKGKDQRNRRKNRSKHHSKKKIKNKRR